MRLLPALLVAAAATLTATLAAGCAHPGGTPPPVPQSSYPTPPAQAGTAHGGDPRSSEALPEAGGGGQRFVVRGTGVRCAAAPCPYYTATREGAGDGEPRQVHELDLSALGLSEEAEATLVERATTGTLRVEGTLSTRPDAGPAGDATVLRVTRVLDKP